MQGVLEWYHNCDITLELGSAAIMEITKFIWQWNVGADLSRPQPIYRPNAGPKILGLFC